MEELSFDKKFIAFVDVLGFKSMVKDAEEGKGRSLQEIRRILQTKMYRKEDLKSLQTYGPTICPGSTYICKDLAFKVTQISDCAVVSAETSPAGAINLVGYCWRVAMGLLLEGLLVRGYITLGNIYHDDNEFMGSGYQEAYERESAVAFLRRQVDEKGTPFIEVDESVSSYIKHCTDKCVREMFSRQVKIDQELCAIYPFQQLGHSFMIGGFGVPEFDPHREKKNNDIVRKNIEKLKDGVLKYVDAENEKAMNKVQHYVDALDRQLDQCDQTDEMIDKLSQPFPGRRI